MRWGSDFGTDAGSSFANALLSGASRGAQAGGRASTTLDGAIDFQQKPAKEGCGGIMSARSKNKIIRVGIPYKKFGAGQATT